MPQKILESGAKHQQRLANPQILLKSLFLDLMIRQLSNLLIIEQGALEGNAQLRRAKK